MKGKSLLMTCLVALLIISASSTFAINVVSASSPKIYVDPPSILVNGTISFTVDIKISDVTDMWGYQFRLTFNPALLEVPDDPETETDVEGVSEGSFLMWGGPSPPENTRITSYLDIGGPGTLDVAGTIVGIAMVNAFPASGNGTLATITFNLKLAGSCPLHLSDTDVIVINPITLKTESTAHTTQDGAYAGYQGYKVAIGQPTTKTLICQKYSGKINCSVRNVGVIAETFNVTAYHNSSSWSPIDTQQVTLNSEETQHITLTWSVPEAFPKGYYLINITVARVGGGGINSYVPDYTVHITMTGDVAPAFDLVDIVDIVKIAIAFGSKVGESEYNREVDIDDNGVIDIVDIVICALHFGETDP